MLCQVSTEKERMEGGGDFNMYFKPFMVHSNFTDVWVMDEGSTPPVKTAELVILVHQDLEQVAGVVWETAACPPEKSASPTHLLVWSASNTHVVSLKARLIPLCT